MTQSTARKDQRLAPGERAAVDLLIFSGVPLERLMRCPQGVHAARMIATSETARDYLCTFAARPVLARRAAEAAQRCARAVPGGKVASAYAVTAWITLALGQHQEAHTFADLAVLAAPDDVFALKVHQYSQSLGKAYAKGEGAGETERKRLIQQSARNLARLTG